ncbi:hypothetical protein [Ichthyenterobacterium magnum]|uniref:Uncharacterized protein n=1 Tax=Ichthyenterobacterium magnum TaxID=1230530 RepID=A0A420DK86_9FLAO|nr:hypothetical protein [Ichthyenterobacterium magnum]RKE94653.1 hypothetical protein BXY80_1661 [Ichthyenterobacterium magnum]
MRNLFSIIIFFISLSSFATVQEKDILIFNGEVSELKNYYLEEYFELFPEKKPKEGIISSNLWRGYRAIFVALDKQIFLVDLEIRVKEEKPNVLFSTTWKSVFDEFSPECDKFLVDWIDDLIILPKGEAMDYEPGFGVSFKNYSLLNIKNGQIVDLKDFSLKFLKKHFTKCHVFLRKEDLFILNEILKN